MQNPIDSYEEHHLEYYTEYYTEYHTDSYAESFVFWNIHYVVWQIRYREAPIAAPKTQTLAFK